MKTIQLSMRVLYLLQSKLIEELDCSGVDIIKTESIPKTDKIWVWMPSLPEVEKETTWRKEEWVWFKNKLSELTLEQLIQLYEGVNHTGKS